MSRSLANSTMRVIQARSTHSVVGLCGNDSTTTRGFGQADSHASMRLSKKAAPPSALSTPSPDGVSSRTWRMSAPANRGA